MNIGDPVPDFELPDQDGAPQRLSTLASQGPVVLFFYPAAMTGGCTAESCHFRDLAAEFTQAGAQRVGISTDSVAKQKQFAELNSFDYPLLSDEAGRRRPIVRGQAPFRSAAGEAQDVRHRHRPDAEGRDQQRILDGQAR